MKFGCSIILLCLGITKILYSQAPALYQQGVEALKTNRVAEAEKFFQQSISQNKDADSYYQLAKLYLDKDDPVLRNRGYEYSSQVLKMVSDKLEYHYLYIDYLKYFGGPHGRENAYRKIFEQFPKEAKALFKIAEIRLAIYEKYRALKVDSDRWMADDEVIPFDMTSLVQADLDSAEALYIKGLEIDPANYEGLFGIVRMYQTTTKPGKAVTYLEKIVKYYPEDKDARLQLGVYYYKKKRLDESFKQLKIAIGLMGEEEKEDFVYNSAVEIFKPKYEESFQKMSKEEKSSFIEKLWNTLDPLYLNNYNERIMEHYARVAYANLFFSVPEKGLKGWQTDRGKVLIRYGEPVKRIKIMPNSGMNQYGSNTSAQFAEVWEYEKIAGFLFLGNRNNYNFHGSDKFAAIRRGPKPKMVNGHAAMLDSRQSINSVDDYEKMIAQNVQTYKPVLYGNKINLDSRLYSFKKLVPGAGAIVETYLAYSLPTKDTSNKIDVKDYTHEIGSFVFDENFNPLMEKRKKLSDADIRKAFPRDNSNMVNCIGFELNSRKISYAFDLWRKIDSNYYTFRKPIDIPDYNNKLLGVSDIILADNVALDKELPFGIKRGDISFYPKPNNKFRNNEQFYIYYEAYNLSKDDKKETNFEQVITIRPVGEEGISLKKIVKGITTLFTGEEGVVSLTTNFRTKEENTQIYMQLDISGYKTGKYDLIITINDKISGKSTERKTDLEIY